MTRMDKAQSDAIAMIAIDMTDNTRATAAEILAALNKAYEAGYERGYSDGTIDTEASTTRVLRKMSAP